MKQGLGKQFMGVAPDLTAHYRQTLPKLHGDGFQGAAGTQHVRNHDPFRLGAEITAGRCREIAGYFLMSPALKTTAWPCCQPVVNASRK